MLIIINENCWNPVMNKRDHHRSFNQTERRWVSIFHTWETKTDYTMYMLY